MRSSHALLCATGLLLAACGTKPIQQSDMHIQQTPDSAARSSGTIPQPSKQAVVLPPPKPAVKVETYSVVVTDVPVREILFALARDANINIDIHPSIEGRVTLNAVSQTLPQILDRISKQVEMRYTMENGSLFIEADKPYLKTYKIDFINMKRTVSNSIFTSSRIGGGKTTSNAGNSAATTISSETKNDLMASVIQNVKDILLDEDKLHYQEQVEIQSQQEIRARGTGSASGSISLGTQNTNGVEINQTSNNSTINKNSGAGGSVSGSGNQDVQGAGDAVAKKGTYERAVNVFANHESGVLIVRATSRQHKKVEEFISKVMNTARRQVLIEATIAEVRLNSNYQQGIDWSRLRPGAKGFSITQNGSAGLGSTNTGNMLVLDYLNPTSKLGDLSASVSLLDSFGDVKVLSSPKLSVMNNQTATLKVVDSKIYFEINAQTTDGNGYTTTTYTTTAHPVDVGFVMNVTPYISEADTVTVNVRPTISRITSYVADPNPALAAAGVVSRVPEIQSREMESIIKIESGQIAVLGGLMQDEINNQTDGIPLLDEMPFVGNAFRNRNDNKTKTELVIFLRPIVLKDASLEGDFGAFRDNLPDGDFLKPESEKGAR